jgi:hypothetical protein
MAIRFINTGTSANAGNGDSIRTAFGKVNENFLEIADLLGSTGTTFLELVEDATADLMIHSGHSGFTVTYDDETDRLLFSVIPGPTGPKGDQGSQGLPGDDGTSVVAALSPPSYPEQGDLWYDNVSGRMYVFYDSGWVDASPAATTLPDDTIYNKGNISGNVTFNRDLGSVHLCKAVGDFTITEVEGLPTGRNFTLIVQQDEIGGRIMTPPDDWKFAGGAKYLSSSPNAIDMINMVRVGTSTYAVVSLGYS